MRSPLRWFVPSRCGDFRLTANGPEASTLSVENATPGELETVRAFLEECKKRGWVSSTGGGATPTVVPIGAPVALAGPVLAGKAAAPKGQFTAVRSVNGALTVEVDPVAAIEAAEKKDEPAAVVTPKKPTLCCPVQVAGPDLRASEALHAFCTPRQWRDWTEKGWLITHGHITGHAYQIAHRHHPLALQRGKITYDLDDQGILSCWDWTVPPAEEVLAVKLLLEGREPWLRNMSGNDGGRNRLIDLFHNPLGDDFADGTDNAALTSGIGRAFQMSPQLWNALAEGEWTPWLGLSGPSS